jgi:ketosteroid isomerase-like protein
MTQENEIVRRGNAAFNSGEPTLFAKSWHPDVELLDLANAADATPVVKGRDALVALWSDWQEAFEDFRAEISEFIDAGEVVLCVTRWVGRGRSSAVSVDVSQVDAYEVRDGQIIRATLAYPDKASALEAVGLSE